jgi:hypothetical protein
VEVTQISRPGSCIRASATDRYMPAQPVIGRAFGHGSAPVTAGGPHKFATRFVASGGRPRPTRSPSAVGGLHDVPHARKLQSAGPGDTTHVACSTAKATISIYQQRSAPGRPQSRKGFLLRQAAVVPVNPVSAWGKVRIGAGIGPTRFRSRGT